MLALLCITRGKDKGDLGANSPMPQIAPKHEWSSRQEHDSNKFILPPNIWIFALAA